MEEKGIFKAGKYAHNHPVKSKMLEDRWKPASPIANEVCVVFIILFLGSKY